MMVAQAGPTEEAHAPPYPPAADPHVRTRGGLRRMFSSSLRLAALQSKIILLQTKLIAKRILISAALWAAATMVGILAIIFLYIGVFRVLTDVVGLAPAWTFLLYALAHILIAGGLMLWAMSILKKKLPGATNRDKQDEQD